MAIICTKEVEIVERAYVGTCTDCRSEFEADHEDIEHKRIQINGYTPGSSIMFLTEPSDCTRCNHGQVTWKPKGPENVPLNTPPPPPPTRILKEDVDVVSTWRRIMAKLYRNGR